MKKVDAQNLHEISKSDLYPHAIARPPTTQQDNPGNYTILIVDDEQPIRELIGLYFRTLGYNVLLTDNGPKAVEFVRHYSVDLVFLDILLPRMDGLAVCTAIREHSEIPVIMLTALNSLDYAARAFQLGADGYITKPFKLSTLKMRAQTLLHNNRLLL
ncbi:MAG: response regulator [Chloroflexi bacterium]|nr:response regulator [Chloroflexota bacterium]